MCVFERLDNSAVDDFSLAEGPSSDRAVLESVVDCMGSKDMAEQIKVDQLAQVLRIALRAELGSTKKWLIGSVVTLVAAFTGTWIYFNDADKEILGTIADQGAQISRALTAVEGLQQSLARGRPKRRDDPR